MLINYPYFFQIVTGVGLKLLFSYSKVLITNILRSHGGRTALLWSGVATQIGSLTGALISFLLVSVFKLFQDAPVCQS